MTTRTNDPPSKLVIAIDGPAGAGKSTVAARLAGRLGIPYLDTGAMYRAVALLALRDGLGDDLDQRAARRVVELMTEHEIAVQSDGSEFRILLDGEDVSSDIRSSECSMMASAVSALPEVRHALVPLQQRLARQLGGVMEGRDIGSVVAPDATLKVFLTASPEERAQRRYRDMVEHDPETSFDQVLEQQRQRDLQDESRTLSPLHVASGSVVVDTSGKTVEEVVERLVDELDRVLNRPA